MSSIKIIPDKRLIDLVEEFYRKSETDWTTHINNLNHENENNNPTGYPIWTIIERAGFDKQRSLNKIINFQKMLLLAMYLNQEVTITPDDCQYFDIKPMDSNTTTRHPVQPLYKDDHGVIRFKPNKLVQYMLENGNIDMNDLGMLQDEYDSSEYEQFAQLIGYSLSGFGELSYVSDETYSLAEDKAKKLMDSE